MIGTPRATFVGGAGQRDPLFSKNSLLLHFDGANGATTTVDSSLTPKSIALNGTAQLSTAQVKFGATSLSLPGNSTSNVSFPTANTADFTGTFTIECWIRLTARSSLYPCIFCNYNSYTTNALGIFAGHNSSDITKFQVVANALTLPSWLVSTTSIAYGAWQHIALVNTGTTLALYVDGVSNGSISSTGMTLSGVGTSSGIGTTFDASAADTFLNGYVDDYRITKGGVRYTSSFTPPPRPYPNF